MGRDAAARHSVELPPREIEEAPITLRGLYRATEATRRSAGAYAKRVAVADARLAAGRDEPAALGRHCRPAVANGGANVWRSSPRARSSTCRFPRFPCPTDARDPADREHEIVTIPSASVLAMMRRETAVAHRPRDARDSRRSRVRRPIHGSRAVTERQPVPAYRRGIAGSRSLARRFLAPAVLARGGDRDRCAGRCAPPLQRARLRRQPRVRAGRRLARHVVHFATHGIVDSDRPALSALILSLFDERGAPQNGYLRLHDIYNMRLDADLVVLSACQTALGKEIKGEGLVGLTRAFIYAGAPRVVASLWQVNDLATAELMNNFYRGLLQQSWPAAALRAAQIELSRDPRWKAPYFGPASCCRATGSRRSTPTSSSRHVFDDDDSRR